MQMRVEAWKSVGSRPLVFATVAAASEATKVSEASIIASMQDPNIVIHKWRFRIVPIGWDEALAGLVAPSATSSLEAFIAENVHEAPGHLLPYGEFYNKFQEWLPIDERGQWSRPKVSRSLPAKYQSGTGNENVTFIINAAWEPQDTTDAKPYYISNGRVMRSH